MPSKEAKKGIQFRGVTYQRRIQFPWLRGLAESRIIEMRMACIPSNR